MDDLSRGDAQTSRQVAKRKARAAAQVAPVMTPEAATKPTPRGVDNADTSGRALKSKLNHSDSSNVVNSTSPRGDARADKSPGSGGKKPQHIQRPLPEPLQRPAVPPAHLRPRHYGVLTGFFALVLLPLVALGVYLYAYANDQFASTTGFTVRSEETSSATEIAGGLSSIIGGPSSTNGDVLYAYIQSQQIVRRVQEQLDLRAHYAQNWRSDPVFSIWPDATIEDLFWFWGRVVRVSYDKASGLMSVQVRAGTAAYAQQIAQAVVRESEAMINELNRQARNDSMTNAQLDLEAAVERLRIAREEVAAFRARTQIVDPAADIQGRMGVINNLQQQLAQSLVDHDLLLQNTTDTDPRVRQALRRIEVIEDRIHSERLNFATQDVTVLDTDYPRLIAQFESLMVNQEFAERTYTAALSALDAARSNAERQSLYLATYIQPTLAERAEYPQRLLLMALAALFMLLIWASLTLVYYSLRDRG
ncbi:sugar transporter [Pararhodobacter oceanensis]|uniref:sugar transporter n=1 Tax=Pararhodobacter oceanensis TaxID=2172121 RepID=UPI003A920A29